MSFLNNLEKNNYPENISGAETQTEVESREILNESERIKRLKELRQKGVGRGTIASCLAFSDSLEAWNLRQDIWDSTAEMGPDRARAIRNDVIKGLAGLDDEDAWQMREKAISVGVDLNSVSLSLRGLDDPESFQMREKLYQELGGKDDRYKNSPTLVKNLFWSLIGLNSPEAWEMRKKLLENGGQFQDYIISLTGVWGAKAREEKLKCLNNVSFRDQRNFFNSLLISSMGQYDAVSEKIRTEFTKGKGDMNIKLDSLVLDDSPEAEEIREKYLMKLTDSGEIDKKKEIALHLGLSIAGRDDYFANEIREEMFQQGCLEEVAISLTGDDISACVIDKYYN